MSGKIVLKGTTSGQVEVTVPAVAGNNTLTLPATTGNFVTASATGDVSVSGDLTVTGDITVSGEITTNKAYYNAYNSSNQANIGSSSTNGGTILTLNQEWQNSGDFSLSSGQLNVNKTGKYLITADVSTYVSSSTTARSQSVARIYINGTMVTGSLMWIYNREGPDSDEGHGNASASIIRDLTTGDVVDIRGYRISGTDTIGFRGNSNRIMVLEL